VNIETYLFRHFGPQKDKFSQGVTALQLLPSGNLLLGTGDGVVAEVRGAPHFRRVRTSRVPGAITSVALRGSGNQFFVGMATAQMYQFEFADFSSTLLSSCHHSAVTDIVFPQSVHATERQ